MKPQIRPVVCALWILMTASYARAAATVTLLGYLPDDNSSSAYGISGDGQVVVGISALQPYVGGGSYRAFRWTVVSGMVGLGHLPGDNYARAFAVSSDGLVVVGSSDRYFLSTGQAFRWTAGSGMVGLGYLPGHTNSSAAAVSGDGSVVVGTSGWQPWSGEPYPVTAPGSYQAFRWTTGSGMVGLGYLPGGTNSIASGVSADGSIVVGTSSSAFSNQAFRWTAGSGMVGLGYLPGYTNSIATGVSADGSVIVGTCFSVSSNEAFRWTAASGMVGLGYLPGLQSSSANAANADGSVVVGESSYASFRWTAGFGIEALPIEGSRGVSADGNTIAGRSEQENGRLVALVVTIPGNPGRPALNINRSSTSQFVLSWPTNYTGFTLQSSTQLGSANWTNCSGPSVSAGYFVVTNPLSAGAQLFRLKK